MLTFAITLDTGEGRATVYTDDLERFLKAYDVELLPRQPCQMQAWGGELHAPYLNGYAGPFVKGKTPTGGLIVEYSEKINKTQCAIEAVRKMGGR